MGRMIRMAERNVAQIIDSYITKGKNQIIFTGAPGTGKTYSVREYVKKHTDNETEYKFVQFHPSYDYSDFVEGLRPVNVEGSDKPTFVRMDGSFKAFCRTIVENNIEAAGYSKDSQTLEALYKSISEKKKNKEKLNEQEAKFDNPEKKYYFIVDEINRADLAKVFGELMFGLEESYRGIENRFDTQYKNLVTYSISKENKNAKAKPMDEFDCFKKGFFIPKNLVFIGTMNDIDRSVESFDFALRRRFQWEEIKANDVMEDALWGMREKGIIKTSINLSYVANGIKAMNKTLAPKNSKFGLSDAYHIGPAYFKKLSGSTIDEVKKSLEVIFDKNVQSIIREYLRGRNSKEVADLVADCRKVLLDGIDESINSEENSDLIDNLERGTLLIKNVTKSEEQGKKDTYEFVIENSMYTDDYETKKNNIMGFRINKEDIVDSIGLIKCIVVYNISDKEFITKYGNCTDEYRDSMKKYNDTKKINEEKKIRNFYFFERIETKMKFKTTATKGKAFSLANELNISEEYWDDAKKIADLLKGKEWDDSNEQLVDITSGD